MNDPVKLLAAVRSCVETEKEEAFERRLAVNLHQRGFVVHRQVECRCDGAESGRVDLLAVPPEDWEHAPTIKALAVEAKMGRKAKETMDEITGKLVSKYVEAAERGTWTKDGVRLPNPSIVLYSTPVSMAFDQAVVLTPDIGANRGALRLLGLKDDERGQSVLDLTAMRGAHLMVERMLWKSGAAILHNGFFRTNRFHPSAPRYELPALAARQAA